MVLEFQSKPHPLTDGTNTLEIRDLTSELTLSVSPQISMMLTSTSALPPTKWPQRLWKPLSESIFKIIIIILIYS